MGKTANIFLIGPMGAGKTSVAKQLARMMKYTHFDSDEEVQKRTGVSISWIFEVETERGFRRREAQVIDELSQLEKIILSTGGGCVTTPENCEVLKERGFVAYLTVQLDQQVDRTSRQRGHRPLIDYPDARERLIQLNEQREPLYARIADKWYETDHQSPYDVAALIYRDFLEWTQHIDSFRE